MPSPQNTLDTFHKQIKNGIKPEHLRRFKTIIKNHYNNNGRSFAWRSDTSPYSILVSEIMLQQTQTSRVAQKYDEWMNAFPTFGSLAKAPLSKVLKVWQGMGYNRRAIALKKCAEIILEKYRGKLPESKDELISLPHIGPNTAGSIAAFAFNKPTVFIETNIRSVYIAFFFPNKTQVDDKDILELVEKTVDKKNPREWYYALMDYGVLLKSELKNPSTKGKQYKKQSSFVGSNRQLRGAVLRALHAHAKGATAKQISKEIEQENIPTTEEKIKIILNTLIKEGFAKQKNNTYKIA